MLSSMWVFSTLVVVLALGRSAEGLDAVATTVDCGKVVGVVTTVPNAYKNETAQVANFRGLPFAEPPLGANRLAPPVPSTCALWNNGVLNASSFRGFCIQPDGSGDEDCLYLNVQVPMSILNRTNRTQLYPVSFYIHGGGLTGGSGIWEPFGSFSAFAGDEGVVAVTINYRLGMLGFIAHEAFTLNKEPLGNYGILDQLLALKWVQRNIKAFGGDPARVTLGGQSSGGTSIFALMAAPRSKGLFRGAVSFSGSPNITLDREGKLRQDAEIPSLLNCSRSTNSEIAACIRALPASVIATAMPRSWNTPGLFHLNGLTPAGRNFAGLVFVDGETVAMSFEAAMVAGLNSDVAIIIANLGQEDNLVGNGAHVGNFSVAEWQEYLRNTTFAAWGAGHADRIATDIFELYRTEADVNPLLAYDSINADYGLTCANAQIAVRAKAGGRYRGPIYVSVNQWPPQWPNSNTTQSFAYHMWDYEMAIMNSWDKEVNDVDLAMGTIVRRTWYALIAHGKLDDRSTGHADAPWREVSDAEGFPAFHNTYVYSRPDRFPWYSESRTRTNYKVDTCSMWKSYGFDERYWWCD